MITSAAVLRLLASLRTVAMGILPDLTTETFRNSLPRSTAMSGAAWEQLRRASTTANNSRVLSIPALPLLLAGMMDTCAEEVAKFLGELNQINHAGSILVVSCIERISLCAVWKQMFRIRGVQSEHSCQFGVDRDLTCGLKLNSQVGEQLLQQIMRHTQMQQTHGTAPAQFCPHQAPRKQRRHCAVQAQQ